MNIFENKNCIDGLKEIKDGSVDLIATDPPYKINYNKIDWDKGELDWNFLFTEFFRILKPNGNLLIFQGWSNVCETIQEGKGCGFCLKNWIIYDRIKGRGAKTNLVSTREDLLWFIKSEDYTYNKIYSDIPKKTKGLGLKNGQPNRALSNVWTDISPLVPWSKERVKHPTQKPLKLMKRIVTIFSNEGDIVLDPFVGSGSTLEAAKDLNRGYIGFEKDSEYFQIASDRLKEKNNG